MCLPRLTVKEREAETRFSKDFLKDPEKVTHQYLELVRKHKYHPEHVFSTDDAKMLSTDYNPNDNDPGVRLAATNIFGTIVHTPANAIAKRAFLALSVGQLSQWNHTIVTGFAVYADTIDS